VHILDNGKGLAFSTTDFLFPILMREREDSFGKLVIENDYFSFLVQLLKGKQFITYGSKYSRAIVVALRTMNQNVQ